MYPVFEFGLRGNASRRISTGKEFNLILPSVVKPIFHIQWHITNLCNLRCQHCYQDDFSEERDLDWRGLKGVAQNILTTLHDWEQIASIHLTGGEPLLKQELFPLLDHLNQSPVVEELGIITNGLLLDQKVVERLSDFPKLKKIKISLDGADADVNDSIRGKGFLRGSSRISSGLKKKISSRSS